jgi:hypothetical protein
MSSCSTFLSHKNRRQVFIFVSASILGLLLLSAGGLAIWYATRPGEVSIDPSMPKVQQKTEPDSKGTVTILTFGLISAAAVVGLVVLCACKRNTIFKVLPSFKLPFSRGRLEQVGGSPVDAQTQAVLYVDKRLEEKPDYLLAYADSTEYDLVMIDRYAEVVMQRHFDDYIRELYPDYHMGELVTTKLKSATHGECVFDYDAFSAGIRSVAGRPPAMLEEGEPYKFSEQYAISRSKDGNFFTVVTISCTVIDYHRMAHVVITMAWNHFYNQVLSTSPDRLSKLTTKPRILLHLLDKLLSEVPNIGMCQMAMAYIDRDKSEVWLWNIGHNIVVIHDNKGRAKARLSKTDGMFTIKKGASNSGFYWKNLAFVSFSFTPQDYLVISTNGKNYDSDSPIFTSNEGCKEILESLATNSSSGQALLRVRLERDAAE